MSIREEIENEILEEDENEDCDDNFWLDLKPCLDIVFRVPIVVRIDKDIVKLSSEELRKEISAFFHRMNQFGDIDTDGLTEFYEDEYAIVSSCVAWGLGSVEIPYFYLQNRDMSPSEYYKYLDKHGLEQWQRLDYVSRCADELFENLGTKGEGISIVAVDNSTHTAKFEYVDSLPAKDIKHLLEQYRDYYLRTVPDLSIVKTNGEYDMLYFKPFTIATNFVECKISTPLYNILSTISSGYSCELQDVVNRALGLYDLVYKYSVVEEDEEDDLF